MKKIISLGLLITTIGVLTACGNSNKSIESGGATGVKKVTVAVETGAKPISFEDKDGKLTGYEVDVLKSLDEKIDKYDFNIESVSAEATQVGLDSGKYAFIGGGLFKNEERQEKYLFTEEPNGYSLIKIYTSPENADSIKTLDDLVNKKIAPVSANGGIHALLKEYNEKNPNKQLTIETNDDLSVADRYKSVDSAKYDALILPNNLGFDDIKKELALKVIAIEEPAKVSPTYFVFAKGQEELISEIDKATKELLEDGTLSKISKQWYGEDIFKYESKVEQK